MSYVQAIAQILPALPEAAQKQVFDFAASLQPKAKVDLLPWESEADAEAIAAGNAKWDAIFASATDAQMWAFAEQHSQGERFGVDDSGDVLVPIPLKQV